MGIFKTILEQQAQEDEDKAAVANPVDPNDLRRVSLRVLHLMMYPALVAAVTTQEGFDHWPITFDEFRTLPDELIIRWEEAVGKVNPHWRPKVVETKAEKRKKATGSTQKQSST